MEGMQALRYLIASLIVVIVGALLGWYLFVSKQLTQTQQADSARGFGTAASFGGSGVNGVLGALSGGSATVSSEMEAPRLWPVTTTPVGGFGFAASSSRLYLAERATGNILIADPSDSSVTRLTNTLRPKVYEALFAADGAVVLRTLTENGGIVSFAGIASSSATSSQPQSLTGQPLPDGIVSLSARSSPDSLFYLVPGARGGVDGYTSDWKGSSPKKVFSSALSEWRTFSLSDGALFIVQKASDGVSGFAYQLKGSAALPYLGPVSGLTVLPRANSTALLYGSSGQGGVGLFARTASDSSVVQLSAHTTADKCVWAPGKDLVAYCAVPVSFSDPNFLNDWYSGTLHTTDTWYRIDVSSGQAEKLFETNSSLSLDVRDPAIDMTGTYLAFKNGYDDTLWMLRITP